MKNNSRVISFLSAMWQYFNRKHGRVSIPDFFPSGFVVIRPPRFPSWGYP